MTINNEVMIDSEGYVESFGCMPSPQDKRDYTVNAANSINVALPAKYERTCPRVKNQKTVNSCVAHATSSILEYYTDKKMSTQFIYGIRRQACPEDMGMGMFLSDACKIVLKYGDLLEEDCPGNDEIVACFAKAEEAYADPAKAARAEKIDGYYLCITDADIKYAILNYGPVLACVKWYDKYSIDSTGDLKFDKSSGYGYHAVMIYGWDENGWLIQNSWGLQFGKLGRFHYSYDQGITEARAIIATKSDDKALVKPTCLSRIITNIVDFVIRLCNKLLF